MWTFIWVSFIALVLVANQEVASGAAIFFAAVLYLGFWTVQRARAGGAL